MSVSSSASPSVVVHPSSSSLLLVLFFFLFLFLCVCFLISLLVSLMLSTSRVLALYNNGYMICFKSRWKPCSSMVSISSMTIVCTAPKNIFPSFHCCNNRPGVATTTSTGRCSNIFRWAPLSTPPTKTCVLTLTVWDNDLITAVICIASSRVGANINTRGRLGLLRS